MAKRTIAQELKRAQLQQDKLIEREYYRQATGRQISILDIPKLYNAVRTMLGEGWTIEAAMAEAVKLFCLPKEKVAP